jgi:NitT/TauT family transport system substrate-binding protein
MRFVGRLGSLLVLMLLASACGRRQPVADVAAKSMPGPAKSVATQKATLQTDWFPQAEHGGFYQALAKGFYADAGLDLEILPGGPGSGIKLKVAKGEADFGMYKSDDVIVAAARGFPFVMIAATFQHDPQAVMVHEDSPVKTLRDLNGRLVIASPSMTWVPFLQKRLGIAFDLKPNTFGLGEFLANPDAIQQCIVTNEPFFARQHGRRVRTLPIAAAGWDCYAALFCRRELITLAPGKVRAFVAASIRGWRDYLTADPEPAHQLILKRNAQMTPELLAFSRGEMIRLALVTGDRAKGEDVGQLSPARIEEQLQVLLNLGLLDTPLKADAVVTMAFLPPAGP